MLPSAEKSWSCFTGQVHGHFWACGVVRHRRMLEEELEKFGAIMSIASRGVLGLFRVQSCTLQKYLSRHLGYFND